MAVKPILFNAEIWKPIDGYENYEVSSKGRVRTLIDSCRKPTDGILKPWEGNKKYLYVTLRDNAGKRKCFAVHRLVLDAFVGKRPEGKLCAHWDGNPHNNNVENLRWATAKENAADRERHGRTAKGENQGNSILDEKSAKSILKLKNSGMSKYEVGHLVCVSYSTVERIWNGESWRCIQND